MNKDHLDPEEIYKILKAFKDSLDKSQSDLKEIKATLLVNYGENGKVIRNLINKEMNPINMLLDVLNNYEYSGPCKSVLK